MTVLRDPLFLVGFMGAGKTTIGRALAGRRRRRFEDTDAIVERTQGRTVAEIFRDAGEGAFREAEERALVGLGRAAGAVVATGGGLFLGAAQRRRMKRLGVVLWLDVSLDEARRRIGADDRRPLWLPDDPIALRAWFDRRRAAYALAHARVDADAGVDDVVEACSRAWGVVRARRGDPREPR